MQCIYYNLCDFKLCGFIGNGEQQITNLDIQQSKNSTTEFLKPIE